MWLISITSLASFGCMLPRVNLELVYSTFLYECLLRISGRSYPKRRWTLSRKSRIHVRTQCPPLQTTTYEKVRGTVHCELRVDSQIYEPVHCPSKAINLCSCVSPVILPHPRSNFQGSFQLVRVVGCPSSRPWLQGERRGSLWCR